MQEIEGVAKCETERPIYKIAGNKLTRLKMFVLINLQKHLNRFYCDLVQLQKFYN